jgi:hypothetical protein
MPKDWEAYFPNLPGKWIETSLPTTDYNCFAFAAGDETRWWDPLPPGLYYWPPNIPRGHQLEHFQRAYETEGFRRCADGNLVDGIEKIAIFLNAYGGVEHAARQESDGKWKSKIVGFEDICHDDLHALSNGDYGDPRCFMERERNAKLESTEVAVTSSVTAKPDPQIGVSNPTHREDFRRLVGAAARKQEPEG